MSIPGLLWNTPSYEINSLWNAKIVNLLNLLALILKFPGLQYSKKTEKDKEHLIEVLIKMALFNQLCACAEREGGGLSRAFTFFPWESATSSGATSSSTPPSRSCFRAGTTVFSNTSSLSETCCWRSACFTSSCSWESEQKTENRQLGKEWPWRKDAWSQRAMADFHFLQTHVVE